MQQTFILISSIIVFISYLIYEWSIVVGKTKPQRMTRFVLLLITILGTASLFAQHDKVAIWLLGICAAQSLVVFLLSFWYGMGGWAKTDFICLGIALVGIVIWKMTNNPALGLYAAVVSDLAGMVPALIKTYRFPNTEFWLSYILDVSAAAFTLLAIQKWEVQGFVYPAYLFIVNLVMLFFIIKPKVRHLVQPEAN